MTDDLTRPLGVNARPSGSTPIWTLFALSLFAVAIVTAGGLYWLQRDLFSPPSEMQASKPEIETPQSEVAVQASPESPQKEAPSGPATLEPAEPTGDIKPLEPKTEIERQEPSVAHRPDPRLIERISSGYLPKRSDENLRPMDFYARQPATEGNFGIARVVLIVGGLGISQTGTQQAIRRLPPDVTLAFAPYGNSLQRWTEDARKAGHELLLQLPMEPIDFPSNNPGQHTLLSKAQTVENMANLHWLMSRMTNYVGVMNYLGGKLLGDEHALKPIFDELAERGLLFVDDGSVRNTRSDNTARGALLPFAKADARIDTLRERSKIAKELEELAKQAKRTGLAIGYANAFPETIAMLAQFAANAEKDGIEITPVSAIVRDPQRE